MDNPLIPAVDAFPIPGPAWLFHFLLVFTFILHMLFMNLTLGGTILAALGQLFSKGKADDFRAVMAMRLMGINTYGISLTITTGIAPLLFVQVLYQQYFYTATIMIAWTWLMSLVLLMVGYYAAYLYKFKGTPTKGSGGTAWLWISAIMFFLIAMVHVAVNLIHSQPDQWAALADNPMAILGDAAFWPRLFHFVLAGLGFSGLVVTWWAARQAGKGVEVELNTKIARYGWKWALWTTLLQIADGFLLVMVLPRPVLLGFMRGGMATMLPFTLGIVLALGLLVMLAKVSNPVEKFSTVNGTLMGMIVTIVIMSITRHQIRAIYLEPVTSQFHLETAPQWGNFILFALLLVAGLYTVYYMVKEVLESRAAGKDAA
ncbi:MAG: hypothetical protein GWP16_01440 [Nitrospirae bacterium]|nr:hypothetical protein [Nitrospirota bacterium]